MNPSRFDKEKYELLGQQSRELSKRGEFKQLLYCTIDAYLALKNSRYEEKVLKALLGTTRLALVQAFPDNRYSLVDTSISESESMSEGENRCSFCGLKKPKTELGAGPNVFICKSCVELFSEVWKHS